MSEPFAVQIYRRFLNGETVKQLARALGIPADRVEKRIHAAAEYLNHRRKAA